MHKIHQIIEAEIDSRQQNTYVVGVWRVIRWAETKLKIPPWLQE